MEHVSSFAQRVLLCGGVLLIVTGTLCAQDALPFGHSRSGSGSGGAAQHGGLVLQKRGLPDDWTHII